MDETIKRDIKAELKRRGLGYARLSEQTGLTEGAIAATLAGSRVLLTKNARTILDALGLELQVVAKGEK